MRGQQLIDYVIDRFDGSIVQDNKWRVNGSNGNHYWVEWHPFHKHYSCGCKGYAFRRTCRHIKELSNTFKKNIFANNGLTCIAFIRSFRCNEKEKYEKLKRLLG